MQKLKSQEFVKSVSTLLSGSSIGLLVNYSAQILMVFFYTKEELGFTDSFLAAATILSTITSLRYEDAIPLPRKTRDGAQIFSLANLFNISINLALLPIIIWRRDIALWMHMPELVQWLWLLPFMAILLNMTRIIETWFTRQKDFKLISVNRIAQNTLGNAFQLGGGMVKLGTTGLLLGAFLGRLMSLVFLWRELWKKDGALVKAQFKWPLLQSKIKPYQRFGLYSMPAALLNTLPAQLIFLVLQKYFSQATVGEFGRGFKLLAIPAALLSSAIGQVFFLQAAEAVQDNHLPETTAETFRRMVSLGLLPTVITWFAAPDLAALILGEEWRMAGVYAQYLAPWIFLSALASPLTRIFDVLQHQKWDLAFSILMFVIQMGVLWYSLDRYNALFSIQCLSFTGVIMRALQILTLFYLAKVKLYALPVHIFQYLVYAIPCEILLFAAKRTHLPWVVFIATVLGLILYGWLFYEFEGRKKENSSEAE
jgi:O-antigen/teichoic acid export membrane protein